MSYKKIETMLKLTPIEQGELRILVRQFAHKFGKSSDSVHAVLRRLSLADFEALSDFVLNANSFAKIDAWVAGRASIPNGN